MAIALSNVMRYDVAVVENHHASTETSLQLRIADSLRARLEEAGHVDDACDCLRDIMTGAAGMPAAFTDADRADARSLAGTILRLRPQTHRQHRGQRSAAPLPYAHRRDRHAHA